MTGKSDDALDRRCSINRLEDSHERLKGIVRSFRLISQFLELANQEPDAPRHVAYLSANIFNPCSQPRRATHVTRHLLYGGNKPFADLNLRVLDGSRQGAHSVSESVSGAREITLLHVGLGQNLCLGS